MSQLFRKLSSGANKFFGKRGPVVSGLRKFGTDVLNEGPKVLNTLGQIGSAVGSGISSIAPEIGIPLMAGSRALQAGGSALNAVKSRNPAQAISSVRSGIQALKPITNNMKPSMAFS